MSAENKVRFGYGAAFFLLLIAFSYSVYTTDQLLYHIKWVSKTNRILHHLEDLQALMKDLDITFQAEVNKDTTAPRGYYNATFASVDSLSGLLYSETGDDYIPHERLKDIQAYCDQTRNFILSVKGKADTIMGGTKNEEVIAGTQNMLRRIKSRITDMQTSEKALLKVRSERLNISSGAIEGINIAILLIALLLAGYSWAIYSSENSAKRSANSRTKRYSLELEKKVAELTTANTELTRLKSMEKYTSTGRIARMIAHEVRNPLTNINLSCGQLMESDPADSHSHLLLETIMRNSKRINQLVSDLLNATKMQELKFEKISINKLLDETLEVAKDRIQLQNVRVEKDYDPEICDVEVDAEKIKIAFLNIMLNAVEAMNSGNGLLKLKTEAREDKCITIISDNGHGLEKESMERIFEPYYTGKSKGTGLGLTNTQNIIISHQGIIEVESELGKGTTFTITLDFAKVS